jgi:uncharacterized membrane protein
MSNTPVFNPYEAPKSVDLLAPSADQIVYDGKSLMIPKHFTFPPICLKTGAATDLAPQRRRKLSWYPPLLAILIVLNILIFVLVAACVSKKGEIYFHLSKEVARKRRNVLLRNWGLFGLSIVAGCLAIGSQSTPLGVASAVLFLLTIILSTVASRFLWAKRIDKTHIWLCGVPDEIAQALVRSQAQTIR